jgi:Fe-S oxidoreductase
MRPEVETITLNDQDWELLVERTGGAAALCYQCGVCTATCPWGLVREGSLSVRTFLRRAQLGIQEKRSDLWLCTSCAQCEACCPRGVPVAEILRSLREMAWERRAVERGLPSMLWSEYWNGNPWSQPPSQRAAWAKDLDLPDFDPHEHEILLYVGCTSSYDRRAQRIARSLVHLLRAGKVQFGVLGEDEPCCGEAVLSVGHTPYFEEIASRTAQVLAEKGVSHLVTISPHCYDVFKNHYPSLVGDSFPTSRHYTQFLAGLVESGRLGFHKTVDKVATFQDPCYLGRRNGEYDAPRQVLAAIPGLELVEMENSHADGLCCGGGGGRMWLETLAGERFSDLRVVEAARTGAAILATACPFCAVCLEDSARLSLTGKLQIYDVAELAEQALDSSF